MKQSILFRVALTSVLAGLLLLPSTANAAERFNLVWMIEPIAPALVDKTVKPGDIIAEAQLMPIRLLAIDEDAVAADGKVAALSGSQFTVLQANLRSACTFTYRPTSGLRRFMFNDQRFTCLVDEDRDGRFESAFVVMSGQIGVPLSQGSIPKKRTAINPVPYRLIPVAEATGTPRLQFKYSHQDKITGHAYFGVCIANSATKKVPCFDGYSGVRSDRLPKEIGAAGVMALATAKQGSAVTISVKRGFERQPFTAMEYTQWIFI